MVQRNGSFQCINPHGVSPSCWLESTPRFRGRRQPHRRDVQEGGNDFFCRTALLCDRASYWQFRLAFNECRGWEISTSELSCQAESESKRSSYGSSHDYSR